MGVMGEEEGALCLHITRVLGSGRLWSSSGDRKTGSCSCVDDSHGMLLTATPPSCVLSRLH